MLTQTHKPRAHVEPPDGLPSAVIRKGRLSWLVWLIPFGAACLCGWFVYRDVISTGPTITISFENVDGLEAKNTQLKFRGADVGQINGIMLSKDHERVEVKAQLTGPARNLARAGSLFWIVRPEFKIGSATGLRTIISGEYITVQPGNGPATNVFMGVDKPPIPEQSNSLQITLVTTNLGSIQEQTPIFYRGIQVGEVLYYQLGTDAREVLIHARITEHYAPLVRPDSKFWNAGGISFHAGLFKGVQISAESASTLITGGIEFATPPESATTATNGASFILNEKPDEKWRAWSPEIKLQLPPQANQTNVTPKSPADYLKQVHP